MHFTYPTSTYICIHTSQHMATQVTGREPEQYHYFICILNVVRYIKHFRYLVLSCLFEAIQLCMDAVFTSAVIVCTENNAGMDFETGGKH